MDVLDFFILLILFSNDVFGSDRAQTRFGAILALKGHYQQK